MTMKSRLHLAQVGKYSNITTTECSNVKANKVRCEYKAAEKSARSQFQPLALAL